MDVGVWPGAAHADVARKVSGSHVLRLREGPGHGVDAVASDRLQTVLWRAGTLEYIPAGADHSHSTTLPSDWIAVALCPSEWDALVDLTGIGLTGPVACSAGRMLPKAGKTVRSLRQACLAGTAGAHGLRLAADLLRHLCGCVPPRVPAGIAPWALRAVTDFVEAHLAEPVTVTGMASVARLTPFHFIAAFERSTGQTPHQYLIGRRLARARQLLRSTDMNIAMVAAECGLASHAHLCALFAERYARTPGWFRLRAEDSIVLARSQAGNPGHHCDGAVQAGSRRIARAGEAALPRQACPSATRSAIASSASADSGRANR